MIHEIATIPVDPDQADAFEAAVAEARPLFEAAKGFRSFALERSIETPGRYLLVIGWESVEAHTVDFRGSPDFQAWRALAGPFFAATPSVEHVIRAV